MASALGVSGVPQENLIRFGVFPQQIALLGASFITLAKRCGAFTCHDQLIYLSTTPISADDNELTEIRSIAKFLASCTLHAQAVRAIDTTNEENS